MTKIIPLFSGNTQHAPEQQRLGAVEAPIIRAALNEVDYSISETYAKVIHMPLQKAAAEVVAASVQRQPAPAANTAATVIELAAYRDRQATEAEAYQLPGDDAGQALQNVRTLYGEGNAQEAA